MSERILALQPLDPDQTAALNAVGGVEVATPDNWQDGDPITILYGWDAKLGPKVLHDHHEFVHWIQLTSAGADYLPLDWIASHHIHVTNAAGVFSPAIAESTIGYLLYFLRGFNDAIKNQAGHFWFRPDRNELDSLANQTVLIYGTGTIGQAIAKLLNGFGTQPVGVNRTGHAVTGFQKCVAMAADKTVLSTADIIINTMPETPQTDHYFDGPYFKQLNGLKVFVNVGRGKAVDAKALMQALLYQNVLNAALDVFEDEPLPKSSHLWDYPNVLITPHISGFSNGNFRPIFAIFQTNLASWMKDGEIVKNVVDTKHGY